tara:strand:- start:95487 stop:95933 length:447 start_codon:yes stop_codon:yes gene_type:complete
MSMDDFMRSLSDQQKAMFLAALQDSGTPPEAEVTGDEDEDDSQWTTTMPPHIREEFENEQSSNDTDFTMSKNVKKQKRRKVAVKAKKNTWSDTGEHRDIETPQTDITPRSRASVDLVDMKCHLCNKTFKVNQSLVYGQYYRCDRCTGR